MALSGDYDFQFMIEELAVGAQFKLPYIHVVVNNSYLGLIRQAQRGFEMDYHVQLSFENINAPELGVYGVDHVAVAEGLGCKAIRVTDPKDAQAAFATARELMAQHRVPVVVEFILERVTNISMGTEIDNIIEFEECSICRSTTRRQEPAHRAHCCRLKHEGYRTVPKFAANLTMLFGELPFLDRFAAAKAAGFSGVEYLFPYDFEKAVLREQLQQHGLTQVLHNLPAGNWAAGERGIAILPDRVAEFRDGVARAIDYAKALDCRQLNCLVGVAPAGADTRDLNEVLIGNLRFAADALAKERIRLLIEPINTLDIPGFFLNGTEQAVQIIADVRSEQSVRAVRHLPHAGDGGRHRAKPAKTSRPHRPCPARRQSRPQRARHRRDQLSLPVPTSRRDRLSRLGRMRV